MREVFAVAMICAMLIGGFLGAHQAAERAAPEVVRREALLDSLRATRDTIMYLKRDLRQAELRLAFGCAMLPFNTIDACRAAVDLRIRRQRGRP